MREMVKMKPKGSQEVDEYIGSAPPQSRRKLKQLRKLIRDIVPEATERISYRMPYFDYRGRLAWYALQKGYIGLYIRPPVIEDHKKELSGYKTTMSAIHLPLDKEIPVALVKKLIRARKRLNEKGE